MRILCLIAFVFLATSFTTNNENFEKVSNSESLEVIKPTEVFRVKGYKKQFGNLGWDEIPLKINVESGYGGEKITVIGMLQYSSWQNTTMNVSTTNQYVDGAEIASSFKYVVSGLGIYFNF